jgi:hypothetical protein
VGKLGEIKIKFCMVFTIPLSSIKTAYAVPAPSEREPIRPPP